MRDLIFLLSIARIFLFPLPLGTRTSDRLVYILWHSLGLQYNYFGKGDLVIKLCRNIAKWVNFY